MIYTTKPPLSLAKGWWCPVATVSGGAKGADRLGERYARERGMGLIEVPAMWETYGRKRAGYLRNALMAEIATHLVAFWNGASPGTRMMINIAKSKGLPVRVIRF